ncbi:MAG: hypothetical protein K6E21_06355 [Bacilli bacterium]|nr:hypothetical protein [Bacilli bacterium]
MDKKLFKTREDIYKKCPSIFWEVSIFCFVVAIGFIALDTVVPGLFIITISLLFIPVLYATYMTLYSIKFGGTVTIGTTLGLSLSYYRRNSFGCFRLLRCFLKTLLVEAIATVILYFLLQAIFENIYGNQFVESMKYASDLYINGDSEGFLDYLSEDNVASFFMSCVAYFSTSCATVAFIFGIAFNSINLYLCANIPGATAQFSTAVFNRFLKVKINSYRKDFWSLQWPLFALLIAGITGGYLLVMLAEMEFSLALPISTIGGIILMIPFAPFYFAGCEALFAKYNPDMKEASVELTNGFLREIKNNINLSEEDKKKIEELLSKNPFDGENKKEENDENLNDITFEDKKENQDEKKDDNDEEQ